MSRQKEYYVFARANQMTGHKFTDDVALCKAISHSQAKKIFSKYYRDVEDDEVRCLTSRRNESKSDIIILTDY